MTDTQIPAAPGSSAVASILAAVDLADGAASRLDLVFDLADRLSSAVIGVAACRADLPFYFDGAIGLADSIASLERREAAEHIGEAEALFRRAAGTRTNIEWRAAASAPLKFFADQVRAADLVIVGGADRTEAPLLPMELDAGDEVMVAFENDHEAFPYVIGSLYNGKNAQEKQYDDKDKLKVIRTISGNEILFDDNGRLVIRNAENSMELSCKDDGMLTILTKGDMTLKADKSVTIESGTDMTIKAGANMKVEAGQKHETKSGQDMKVESGMKYELSSAMDMKISSSMNSKLEASLNLEAKAGMNAELSGGVQMKASGGAQAEVSAGAMTTVKGGMVMIN